MKTFYSCVVDINPRFHYQCWLWVHSLLEMASVPPSHIWVQYIEGVDEAFLSKLGSLGVRLKKIDKFGDGKYCNKISQLSNEALMEADMIILMDTDMIVTQDFSCEMDPNCVSGKIVDFSNPEISILDKIFSAAGIFTVFENRLTDLDKGWTYSANFNGGLYVIPRHFIKQIFQTWKKRALWLLEHKFLHEVGRGVHVDQVSFCMAIHELNIPIEHLDRKFNYPIHANFTKDSVPIVFHYHAELSTVGLLNLDPNSTAEYKQMVRKANLFIQKHFDNLIFWNYRYSVFPELGSGIGSRGDNLRTKRDYLQRLEIEHHSVLDIGCGDLELMKDLEIKSYVGLDSSEEALNIAQQTRPGWKFLRVGSVLNNEIPSQEYVTCFDVLIHQNNAEDFNNLIDLMISKTKKRLLVSGYSNKQEHHDTNHMLAFHKSLPHVLSNSGKFESVIKLFKISDTDYYACDIEFDMDFWKDFFAKLLIDKIPDLQEKKVYLHIGTPKTGSSSLQKYLFENRTTLIKQGFIYPEDVIENRHQNLLQAVLNHDWLSFMRFFENIAVLLVHSDTILVSSEGFYNYTSQFSEVGKLFWQAMAKVVNLKIIVYLRKHDEFLESFYRQCVINPKVENSRIGDPIYGQNLCISDFLEHERVKANIDYASSLKVWCRIAGEENVIVRPYKADIIGDFLKIVNIDESELKGIDRQNTSLPIAAVELIRRCNAFLDVNAQKMLVEEVKSVFTGEQVNSNYVNKEIKQSLEKEYSDGMAWVAKKWPAVSDALFDIEENEDLYGNQMDQSSASSTNKNSNRNPLRRIFRFIHDYRIIKQSGLFDEEYYQIMNPNVKTSGSNRIVHYIRHGVKEKRNPSEYFDTDYYLACNQDVLREGLNPFVHYILYGQKEGRPPYNEREVRKLLKESLLISTEAPNDMSSEIILAAVGSVEFPREFNKVVQSSRELFGWYTKHFPRVYEYPWLINKLRGYTKGKKVADFGAGLSPLPVLLAEQEATVTTIDNHTLLRSVNELFDTNEWGYFDYSQLNPNITSLNVTMNEKTFPDHCMDVWYSISVIEHMPSSIRREILLYMRKSLKKNGRLLLTIDLEKNSNRLWNYSEGKMVEDAHLHGTMPDIENELRKLGFSIMESRCIRLPNSERVDLGLIEAKLSG
ncbi:hypothetical protein [Marinicrinis sediminis]|uniref:Methyltransferase domain-containing protein n=1 Tax=Marinicrinis sediminis TaxID=1652465 RepID=A0ABW5RBB3_9BACL